MTLKNKQITFNISYTTTCDEVLEGQFTAKRLNVAQRSRLGVRKSQLSGGMYCVRDANGHATGQGLDEETDWLNTAIAHLELALIQKPQWWKLEELEEVSLIQEVFEKVLDFESSFFRRRRPEPEVEGASGVSAAGSSEPTQEQQLGNVPTQVVGPEVQAALDA